MLLSFSAGTLAQGLREGGTPSTELAQAPGGPQPLDPLGLSWGTPRGLCNFLTTETQRLLEQMSDKLAMEGHQRQLKRAQEGARALKNLWPEGPWVIRPIDLAGRSRCLSQATRKLLDGGPRLYCFRGARFFSLKACHGSMSHCKYRIKTIFTKGVK